ncbi:hypothetical protein QBC34DRAFT_26594 [Podospora aff. communis PSN243]|uniref:EthD domain-containing protein n=1 Tax=Podospora aff. communis PSN243 TaxID=3040156 RepID=A0AAV9GXV2_9PEZI|nr:hypothetical protein QBC34DRAFT_26594 [Podospora aff. communis PSN243]
MPAILVTAYEQGAEVDLDYYVNVHMPKAFSLFQPLCRNWRVVKASPAPGMADPYEIMTFAEFDKVEDIWATYAAESFKPVAKWIEEDTANYAKAKPKVWVIEEAGKGGQ